MLAVWRLQDDAYSLAIQEEISRITGYEWSLGSIYTPLERLDRKRLLTSVLGASTPERGGRKKRLYQVTPAGRMALARVQEVEHAMRAGLPSLVSGGMSS